MPSLTLAQEVIRDAKEAKTGAEAFVKRTSEHVNLLDEAHDTIDVLVAKIEELVEQLEEVEERRACWDCKEIPCTFHDR